MSESETPKVPKVRHSLILVVSEIDHITVTEMREKVKLDVRGFSVDLTLSEARTVAEHLNRIARRIATRPSYKP